MQSIINKLPEVIKCIIYDHVSFTLNYKIELCSDKFIGNPIDLYNIYPINNFYHINKLTRLKTQLHIIGLECNVDELPPEEILNKLQKFSLAWDKYDLKIQIQLPNIKILTICGYFTEIPNFVGLLELSLSNCPELIEIPNIIGLNKLDCYSCNKLTKIPHIKGLLELNCYGCIKITKIPHIVGLLVLDCSWCEKIIEIPHIKGLLKLNCSFCNITEIPHIVGLLELRCISCYDLIEIPHIIELLELECSFCDSLIITPFIMKLKKALKNRRKPCN